VRKREEIRICPSKFFDAWVHCVFRTMITFVTPRSWRYGDVTATYIRRSEILSRIYAKHQYWQESEYGSKWCIIHSNTWVQLQGYHQGWFDITIILHHQNGAIARLQGNIQTWTVKGRSRVCNRETREAHRGPRRMELWTVCWRSTLPLRTLISNRGIHTLQAPKPGHEDPGESDETPQASGNTKAKWRVWVSTYVTVNLNYKHENPVVDISIQE